MNKHTLVSVIVTILLGAGLLWFISITTLEDSQIPIIVDSEEWGKKSD